MKSSYHGYSAVRDLMSNPSSCLPQFRLFDVIRDHEEVVPIAQLAEDHHRRYGKPLRIAVDEADWRYNNLTQAQVYAIRDSMRHCHRTTCFR